MSLRRALLVFRTELAFQLKRPLTWILVVVMALTVWGLSTGGMRIQSGDASVGGTKSWITSEFAVAFTVSVTVFLFYIFFVTVAAGMAVIQDDERKVGEILRATPLTVGEYATGKLFAILAAFGGVLAVQQLASMLAYYVLPNAKADEIRGPFTLSAFVVPAIAFGLPTIVFTALTSFAVGLRWRKPILVFVLPVAMILVAAFFLWNWSPTWLDPGWNKLLMAIDPGGFRWLNETLLKVDRGVDFYNKAPIPFDGLFVGSRFGLVALAAGAFVLAVRREAHAARGELGTSKRAALARSASERTTEPATRPATEARPLAALAMRSGVTGFLAGTARVARAELRELAHAPGLYLFVPLILIQTLGAGWTALGPFGTYVLATPGTIAVRMMNTLTLLVCLLLLFYTTESHQRERHTGLAAIVDATPLRTASTLFGKSVASAVVAVVVLVACFVGCAIVILVQGKVPVSAGPFLIVWGLLLVPTFFLWACFVTAVVSVTRNRYATYAVGLVALAATGVAQFKGWMNWVFNWDLWGSVLWSDMGPLELSRRALVENRLLACSLAVFFVALAMRFHGRRESDPVRIIHRLRPRAILGTAVGLSPWAVVPAVLAAVLAVQVGRGFQSDAAKKKAHDYWKQNLATWNEVPEPEIVDMTVDLTLDPVRSGFTTKGSYRLRNPHDAPIARFALTGGFHWGKATWTLDGKPYTPANRTHLFVFEPKAPLPPGGDAEVSFSYDGTLPAGITKNGGGMGQFILPCGVVLTSFSPSFLPEVGYDPGIGIDKDENQYEPKDYPDDFYKGITEPAFGSGSAFTARVTITGPADYAYNSVGVLESDTVKDGKRTEVWQTDTKVRFLNVVAGRWAVRKGKGIAIYYDPAHTYNIDEIAEALEGARTWYSKWFHEFPWKELKLSEFPGLATYAQGFPTDITFSESIGFLTRQEKTGNAPFTIAAHESAHQWWGNMLLPGKGPGGNLLSEGMAHFSTILLTDKIKGPSARIEFCKRIEEDYGDKRQVDSEKPMVKIDGSKPGDTAVTYDKMGWVAWMLLHEMGRDNLLRGLHDFQAQWDDARDHPVLQDLTAFLRPYAPDPEGYDAFVKQWFTEVVVPEYRLSDARKEKDGDGWVATVTVTNKGTGTMPVAIAAVTGDRFDDEGKPEAGYRDFRETVTLGAGASKRVKIRCTAEPKRIVVDPDAVVLQLERKNAAAALRSTAGSGA